MDLADLQTLDRKIERLAGASQCAAARAWHDRDRRRAICDELLDVAPKVLPYIGFGLVAARSNAPRGQAHPVRRRARRAARHRPRHLSVRHLVEHGGGAGRDRLGARARRDRLRARHLQGLHDARRRRAVSDRADTTRSARRWASAARNSASSPAGRAAAAGSTRCWCARPCAPAASTASP